MAAVRHLRILYHHYRTTHEVFSLGYISLSNFVLIRYIVLKIWGFEVFAELAWILKCLVFTPQNFVFWGSGPLKIIHHCRDPQKAHLHLKPRIMSVNVFNSVIFVTCRRDERNCLCVCLCVFVSKKTKTSPICPPKMGEPISVNFCTTTRLTDVMIYSERFLTIFNHFVFTGGRIFHYCIGLANRL